MESVRSPTEFSKELLRRCLSLDLLDFLRGFSSLESLCLSSSESGLSGGSAYPPAELEWRLGCAGVGERS